MEKLTIEQYRKETGLNNASHSNRGLEFEDLLERTHHYYSLRKLAFVQKNPVIWRYVSKSQFDTFRDSSADFVAKTNRGLYLKKFKSDVDFSGVIAPHGRAIYFDAKQIKGKSLPLGNIAPHQIEILRQAESAGAFAGLMICFSDLQKVFFVPAQIVEKAYLEILYQKGIKSLSLALCEADGVEIRIESGLVDYLEAVK